MKRLAALFLAVWLLLLMGCAASRQLEQVCGAENWSSVQLVERYDRAGEEAVTLSPDAVSPEALRALLHEAYASPPMRPHSFPCRASSSSCPVRTERSAHLPSEQTGVSS